MSDNLTYRQLIAEHIITLYETDKADYDESIGALIKLGYSDKQADELLFRAAVYRS